MFLSNRLSPSQNVDKILKFVYVNPKIQFLLFIINDGTINKNSSGKSVRA